ncbi:hypothetical protein [Sphingobium sp.]|uniref:hypothetical protein n=1 Tax=Sphingobium sp. TaxID=1912891 RepID=UPI003BB7F26D
MTIRHYVGETHRIVANRQGRSILLGWTNGMAQEEMALFEAYFGTVWIEEVIDQQAEALGHADGLQVLGYR